MAGRQSCEQLYIKDQSGLGIQGRPQPPQEGVLRDAFQEEGTGAGPQVVESCKRHCKGPKQREDKFEELTASSLVRLQHRDCESSWKSRETGRHEGLGC